MGNNAHQTGPTNPSSLQEVLFELHDAGRFEAAILASGDGLLIATVPTDYDSELTAATVALVRKVSSEAQERLGIGELDEVTVRSRERKRLVCRYIPIGEPGLILVVIAPPGHYYRRLTNRAIRQIERLVS